MPLDELLTRWTVRLSLLLYAAALAALLVGRSRPAIRREARLAWTAGCVLLWVHLAVAFHFYHDWSHQAAYEATARDTEQSVGWAFGGGVYFNYVLAVVWAVHAANWWKRGSTASLFQGSWWEWAVHGFLFFMAVNATVVFAQGDVRWVSVGVMAGLAAIAFLPRARV